MGRREVFDPARSFAANREFSWGGQVIKTGAPFSDKSHLRRLRQLYDSRYIRMLPPLEESDQDELEGRPPFTKMTVDEIRGWMLLNNVIAHEKSTHASLVRKARLLWEEIKSGVVRPPIVVKPQEPTNGVDASGDQQPDPARDSEGVQEPVGQGDAPKRTRLRS